MSTTIKDTIPMSNGKSLGQEETALVNGGGVVEDNSGDLVVLKDDSVLSTDAYIDQLIPVIKKSIKQNSLETLLNNLEETIFNKESDLEKLSFDSSKDVLKSIDTVKQIKDSSNELSQQVVVIQKQLSKTGYELNSKKKILMNYKKISNKISETIYVLQSCLQILELTNKIMDMISKKNFYNALKALDDLSNLYSNNEIFENFEFTRRIYTSIPKLRSMCKDDSITFIKKWLTQSIERNYANIGQSVTKEIDRIIEQWTQMTETSKELQNFKINSAVELSLRPDSNFDPLSDIDLRPIYDGLLVYETLGEEESLRSELHSEMLNKRDRLLKDLLAQNPNQQEQQQQQAAKPTNGYHRRGSISKTATFSSLNELSQFTNIMLGMLITDHLINQNCGSKLRSDTNMKDLYNSLASKIAPCINNFLDNKIHTLQDLEKFRDIVGLFVVSLDNYGYEIDVFYNILVSAYKKFTTLSFAEFKKTYQGIIDTDDSLPMNFNDKQLYLKICALSWYKIPDAEYDQKFPKALPFSSIYPMTCVHLRNHITANEKFKKRYYTYRVSDLDKIMVSSLDNVLTNIVIGYLSTKLDSTIKEEISQNLINLEFFSNSIKELERLISKNSKNQLYLKSYNNFIQLRKNAESKIFEMVDGKVFDLVETVEWDFRTKQQQQEPSIFIKDIGEFLEMMFNTNFNNLPTSIRQLLLFRSFDLIADHFLRKIREANLITSEALQIFEMDVKYLESIVNSMNEGVRLNHEQHQALSINSTFIEMNQVIELLKSGSLQYFKQHQNTKFTRIKPEEVSYFINKLETVQQERRQAMLEQQQQNLRSGTSSPSPQQYQHHSPRNSRNFDYDDDAASITSVNTNNNETGSSSRFARFKFNRKD